MRCTTSGAPRSGCTPSVPPTNMAASEAEADLTRKPGFPTNLRWLVEPWWSYISPLTGVVPCCSLKNWDDPPSAGRQWISGDTVDLGGGWTNPLEKYYCSQIGSFPQGWTSKILETTTEIWRENQLRLVIDPNIYKVLYIQTVVVLGSEASTVPSSSLALKQWLKDNEDEYLDVPGS